MSVHHHVRLGRGVPAAASLVAIVIAGVSARPASQAPAQSYTLMAGEGRRALPFRPAGATDLLALDLLAGVFDFRTQEDPQAGGLAVVARGQRIGLTPGQPLVSVSGRLVQLSGPVVHEGQAWFVPVDFISRALGPAISQRIEVRRASRLIIVGDLRVPQVQPRVDRQGPNGRLVIDVQPPATHRTTRDGNRLIVRFDADAIDLGPMAGAPLDFVTAARAEGPSLIVDLGPAAATSRADDADPAHVTIDLIPAAAPAGPGRSATPQEPPPAIDLTPSGVIRTVVIDPGHGGDDIGARGAGGTMEKDVTLQMARRLKAALESRVGVRVLLTREGDETLPVDRRTALANNNKADLLLSLHVNASRQATARGAQVLSLSLDDYRNRARGLGAGTAVPVAGGGTRIIDAVPWDLAQIPHAGRSAAVSAIVARHLTALNVTMYGRPIDQAPLRILVGANMPAVLVECGFLSNVDDERALAGGDLTANVVEALVATIMDIRNGIPMPPGGGR